MALNSIRKATFRRSCLLGKNTLLYRRYSLYEPDYLETAKSKIPVYPMLNVQIRGYVYPLLESYQSFIHKVAEIMEIDVDNGWPLPAQKLKVQKYKPQSTAINAEYNLSIYERNIQLADVTSIHCPILIRTLEAALPEGVSLNVEIFSPALEEKRYIPDKELLEKKSMLETITQKK